MNYSKGICWIDDCRIPFVDDETTINHNGWRGSFVGSFGSSEKIYKENTQGRFPANLLVSDDMLNDGMITKADKGKGNDYDKNWVHYGGNLKQKRNAGFGDKGTNSRYYDIDIWFNNLINNI